MKTRYILQAWGKILAGGFPALSIEVTRECPLSCPGCYAYGNAHLGSGLVLRSVRDFKGQELIDGILKIVDAYRPLHVSLVGGEPLVRHRELTALLPLLEARNVHTQVVTSAVRPIPEEWRVLRKLNLAVSIDGLQPEHDARRTPATYARILKHISGHWITVHCTITRQMTERPGYLREFLEFWSLRPEVRKIWLSLFTPQKGETSYEILPPSVRVAVLDDLSMLKDQYPKLDLSDAVLRVYRNPPRNPSECLFATTTLPISPDLKTVITPCQFGGDPDCSQCGCFASAALGAVLRRRLPLGLSLGMLYRASCAIRHRVESLRHTKPVSLR